ncbi:MAG: hypothetical protein BV457_01165 [Thermoplasmata archaeon M9B1D]|nr:MAG: hypothetical protein BV457_01165 [Thermoplasmata archaeon M9B1D]
MKLNLGCGKDIKPAWINVDKFDYNQDIIFNLDTFPYPFDDNSFNVILMKDVIEHLKNPINCLKEIYRISKDRCILIIRTPHPKSPNMKKDITHISPISPKFLSEFNLFPSEVIYYELKQSKPFRLKFFKIVFWNQLLVLIVKK